MKKQTQKKIQDLNEKQQIQGIESNFNRARSITVGTAFGGTTEITMRSNSNEFIWCSMQPVEVIELIHQLAANVGCHIALKPRDDFSSWREWRVSEAEKKHLNGHPPFVNDMALFQKLGINGFNQDETEAIIKKSLNQKSYEYTNGKERQKELKHETVATKKSQNRRSVKQSTTTA